MLKKIYWLKASINKLIGRSNIYIAIEQIYLSTSFGS